MQLTSCISGYAQNGGLFEQNSISVLFCFVFLSIYLFFVFVFFPSLSRVLVLPVQVQL